MKRIVLRELGLGPWTRWANYVYKQQRAHAAETTAKATDAALAPSKKAPEPVSGVDLGELARLVASCTKCELCQKRKQTVFGRGSEKNCEVLIVGEGPGEQEDMQGMPFVGRAGELLGNMMVAARLDAGKNTYITNVVKCRPPDNRNPFESEVESCLPYLRRQIQLLSPSLILVTGKVAGNALLKADATMADLRGKVHEIDGIAAVATYHPAYLLRRPTEKRKSWDDLLLARRTLDKLLP